MLGNGSGDNLSPSRSTSALAHHTRLRHEKPSDLSKGRDSQGGPTMTSLVWKQPILACHDNATFEKSHPLRTAYAGMGLVRPEGFVASCCLSPRPLKVVPEAAGMLGRPREVLFVRAPGSLNSMTRAGGALAFLRLRAHATAYCRPNKRDCARHCRDEGWRAFALPGREVSGRRQQLCPNRTYS